MRYNINSGFGKLIAERLSSGVAGKLFLVGKSAIAYRSVYTEIFGTDPEGKPRFASTIAGAVAQCTANSGDVIVVLPGHTETVVGAAGIALNVAGVTITGLGNGSDRPTISFTTSTAASLDISAANVTLKNLILTCGIDAQLAMVNVTAADVTFENCEFNTNSGTVGAVAGILTAATATRLAVLNCRFLGPAINAGTTTTAQIKHEVGVDYRIEGNYFTGKMTQAIVNVATVLRGTIHNNRFVVATGTVAITMAAASTPFITNNRINVPSGTAPIVAAAGFVAGNVYSAAAGVTAGTASTI